MINVELIVPKRDYMETFVSWRNSNLKALRTSRPLTLEQQLEFYDKEVCNRQANSRYYAIKADNGHRAGLAGFCGINNIQWENRIGEISLIIGPESEGLGIGRASVYELLKVAFCEMGLATVCGEVYQCNSDGLGFWNSILESLDLSTVLLPNRKFHNGRLWDSEYFSISHSDPWEKLNPDSEDGCDD